ncbi:MAG: response regulator transcription factor [Halobacteriaceae archaeon]
MSNPEVLIVDDEVDLADLYAELLNDSFSTAVAYNGEEALDILEEHSESLEVVLLDRLMPDMSGDEVLEQIEERDIDCSVVMLTGAEPDFDVVHMGFDDYLTKPVTKEKLNATVDRLIEQSGYDEKTREHIALVRKKTILEEEKDEEELAESDEYTELQEKIVSSRNELNQALRGDVFVELLLRETGDRLYLVLEYDSDSWSYRYLSDIAEETIAQINPDLNDLLDQFRNEGQQRSQLKDIFNLDEYYCSLHLYEAIVLLHFHLADQQGIICGFDPEAASHLNDFVNLIRPYLENPQEQVANEA